jgi:hypothetical protein
MNRSDDMIELKSCPFCGGKAEFGEVQGDENTPDVGGNFIDCTNPVCQASTALIFPLMDDVKQLLVERWNRRLHEEWSKQGAQPVPPTAPCSRARRHEP